MDSLDSFAARLKDRAWRLANLWIKVANSGFDVHALPVLDLSAMMPVLLGMLGLGGLRTVEKIRGAAPASHA